MVTIPISPNPSFIPSNTPLGFTIETPYDSCHWIAQLLVLVSRLFISGMKKFENLCTDIDFSGEPSVTTALIV